MMKTILIVDDSEPMRGVMRIVLMRAGYQVVEACDGRDALSRLEERKFDLVVSDLNMPNMDGISLVNAMKRLQAHESIPVIMLSSEMDEEIIKQGLSAGAAVWLSKPFQPARMLVLISELVNS